MANFRIILAAAFIGLALPLGGCESGNTTGEVGFSDGSLNDVQPVGMERAYQAVVASLSQLGYPVTSEQKGDLSSRIEAQTTDHMPIWIKLNRSGERQTNFRIRVGFIGDEATARALMGQIKRYL
jgi:hypothetical protein